MKPLDFVKTPKGNLAIVKEVTDSRASIAFIGKVPSGKSEKNAWWEFDELEVIDNLPNLLARTIAHPFGGHAADADIHFPISN